jgi:hypothetical protein
VADCERDDLPLSVGAGCRQRCSKSRLADEVDLVNGQAPYDYVLQAWV